MFGFGKKDKEDKRERKQERKAEKKEKRAEKKRKKDEEVRWMLSMEGYFDNNEDDD